jgi:hypothetical protein
VVEASGCWQLLNVADRQQLFGQPIDQLLASWTNSSFSTMEPCATTLSAVTKAANTKGMITMAANRARQFALTTQCHSA